MDKVIVAEVLGRRGDVVERLRLERFPATIGRAWSNDVVLADPTVDAHHARIWLDETGAAFLEDLGSLNGLHVGAARETVRRVALDGIAVVRVGRTTVRLGALDTPVAAAVPELAPAGRFGWLMEKPPAIAAIIALAIVILSVSTWLDSYKSQATATVSGTVVAFVALVTVWVGVWSMIGRLSVQRFRFWQHNALTWLAMLAVSVLGFAYSWLGFMFPTSAAVADTDIVIGCAIFVSLIAAQLGLVSAMRRWRRIAVGAVVTAVLIGLAALTTKAAKNQMDTESDVRISAALKPLPAGLIPAGSLDTFLRSTDGLKKEVDGLLKE